MSRLLHAAARGARIERSHFKYPYAWEPSRIIWVTDLDNTDCDYDYRIHPKDEALQYGPISTALRAWALLEPSNVDDIYIDMSRALLDCDEADWFRHINNELHRWLYLQFMAEALADEGL